jgi:hypothetical protein
LDDSAFLKVNTPQHPSCRAGGVLIDPAELPFRRDSKGQADRVMLREFNPDVNACLATLKPNSGIRSLAELLQGPIHQNVD